MPKTLAPKKNSLRKRIEHIINDDSFESDEKELELEYELEEDTSEETEYSGKMVGSDFEETGEEEAIKLYLHDISMYPLLSLDEEKEIGIRIKDGDEEALQQLINANLRLVVKIAKQYCSPEYPLIDVIQDGNIGLMRAASKFDYTKNAKFSTYASWWIKQTIIRNLSIKKRMIRIPHRKEDKLRKLKKAFNSYYQDEQQLPSSDELATGLDIDKSEIDELMSYNTSVVSYDVMVGDDSNSIKDLLSDNTFRPDTELLRKELRKHAEDILSKLSDKEQAVLRYRYGFDGSDRNTLKNMGEKLGISAETVRQIELRILRKLRTKYSYLKDYLR